MSKDKPTPDGRAKTYDTRHYNLSAIITIGYKVNSERAVQFRKWATGIIKSFTIKGYAMNDERLFESDFDRILKQSPPEKGSETHAEARREKP
jgi:hypothetical protein